MAQIIRSWLLVESSISFIYYYWWR